MTTGSSNERRPDGRGRWLALGAIVASSFVLGLDSTILVTALPTLSIELHATIDQLQWISAAYLLALAGFQIPAGALGDRLGRRRMLLVALATFGLASIGASQATTATALIATRAAMGVAGAFIVPISLAVLPTVFSTKERPRAVAIGGAAMFLGLPLGPLAAGWLLTHYAWGSIFLINAPFVILAMIGVWFWVPESRDPRPADLDVLGAALAIAGVTTFVCGVIELPVVGWGGASAITGLLIGGILLVGFVVHELRTTSPLVDLRLFGDRRFACATLVSVVMSFVLTGLLFAYTPFLQVVQGADAQGTGIRLLPLIGGIVFGALDSQHMVARFGPRKTIVLGLVGCSAGMMLMSLVGPASGDGLALIALPMIGIGNAVATFTALNVVIDVVPLSQTGAGIALARTASQVGASLGVAVLGSLLGGVYRSELSSHLTGLPAQLRAAADGGISGAVELARQLPEALGAQLQVAAREAYGVGMSDILRVAAAVTIAAALMVAAVMREQGRRQIVTTTLPRTAPLSR